MIRDFGPRPYGRYATDGDYSGEVFRESILAPALKENDEVIVDLSGYNRYGRSFLDEAFGGLIRASGFRKANLRTRLKFKHDLVKSIEEVIADRIDAAEKSVIDESN